MIGLVALAFVLAQEPAPVDTAYFLHLENVWNQAHMLSDTTALDSLWDEALIINAPRMKPITKSEALAFWRSGRVKFLEYETSDVHVRTTSTHEVIVSGSLLRKRKIGDNLLQENLKFKKLYRKVSRAWRVISWTATESNSK